MKRKIGLIILLCLVIGCMAALSACGDGGDGGGDGNNTDNTPSYTVTYQLNGGGTINPNTQKEGSSINAPTEPTRNGFRFVGWFDEELTTQKTFPFTLTENITLYAKWIAQFTVTFETNGGNPISPTTQDEGSTFTEPADAVKEHQSFGGWFTDETLKVAAVFPLTISANIKLYAKWLHFEQVSAGNIHSLAIDNDGNLWAWGNNANGQLGDGSNTHKLYPSQIMAGIKFKSISAGLAISNLNPESAHSLAIDEDGNLWTWGSNSYGQLGDGTNLAKNVPVKINEGTKYNVVSAGLLYSIALDVSGNLWTWGSNSYGQLGDGTNLAKNVPVKINNGISYKSISAGRFLSLAIDANDCLWAFGQNSGNWSNAPLDEEFGSYPNSIAIPIQMFTDKRFKSISSGATERFLIDTNGHLYIWISKNADAEFNGLHLIQGNTLFNSISINKEMASGYAIDINGKLWQWSYNEANSLVITKIYEDNSFFSISVCYTHFLAIDINGNLWTFGHNESGQLGDGTTTNSNIPILIPYPTD